MYRFNLTSLWQIPAPPEIVWNTIIDTQAWPEWWQYVTKVEELQPGDNIGLNNIRRYTWTTCLPYQLKMELCVSRLEPCRLIETQVAGDLLGLGRCRFSTQPGFTRVQYEWNVSLNKPWMICLAPIAHPVFIWNHRQVMKKGEQSLIQRLSSGP